jgi:membrane dipeptidase
MTSNCELTRRLFLTGSASAGLLVASGFAAQVAAAPAASPGKAAASRKWPGYAGAIVIDALASPGYFNYPVDVPLDQTMARNAVESGITVGNLTVSRADFEQTVAQIAAWTKTLQRFPEAFHLIRSVADIRQAKQAGRFGILFGFQDSTPLQGDLNKLEIFDNLGVRIVQLTYNVRNLAGDGCLEPANGGLSRYGHALIEAMNERGMLVDLSHCGQRTTAEGIATSRQPVSITHSGCNEVSRHPRNKDDAELRALAERGGVIGIYLMPFLVAQRPPKMGDVIAHIEHAVKVCGEDHVGIGSDLSTTPIDGSEEYWRQHRAFVSRRIEQGIAAPGEDPDILFTVGDLNHARRMELIASELSTRGHSAARIEKILGGNFLRLFGAVWPATYQ